VEGHSGYDFPMPISILLGNIFIIIPFIGISSEYHDFHHSKNTGNYSSFYSFWDSVFGCNADYYEHLKEIEDRSS